MRANRASLANRGKSWETTLGDIHEIYNASGRASITRNPTPWKILRSLGEGKFVCVPERSGAPDYHAQVGALSLLFDAKEAQGSWPLDKLEEHQAESFDRHEAQGPNALAFVLAHAEGRVYLLPWSELRPLWRRWWEGRQMGKRAANGTASLDAGMLAEVGFPLPSADWLGTAMELWAGV